MPLEGKDSCFINLESHLRKKWFEACDAFESICMEQIMPESQEECPFDTGTLKSTGPISSGMDVREEDFCTISLGYGTSYALRQHEDLTYRHKIGKAKYLEDPIMRHAPTIPQEILRRVTE
jgi:hypothetical protein